MTSARLGAFQLLLPALGWALVGVPVAMLVLRFGMRAVGVRPDVPLPDFIYRVTSDFVSPFYRYFPADARFDRSALEVAALAAAGAIFLAAVGAYLIGLLLSAALGNRS